MRPSLLIVALLAFPLVAAAQQQTPTNQPTAAPTPPPLTDAQVKSIADVKAAASLAAEVIKNSNTLKDEATVLTNQLRAVPQSMQLFDSLYPLVRTAAAENLVAKMGSASSSLADQKTKVGTAKTALGDTSTAAPQEIQDAASVCTKTSDSLDAAKTSLDSATSDLKAALPKAYAFFTATFTLMDTSIKPLMDLASNEPNVESIRQTLSEQAANYALQCATYPKLKAGWDNFNPKLGTLLGSNDQATAVTTKATAVNTDLNGVLVKFKGWFDALNTSTGAAATAANSTASALIVDYARTYDDAVSKNNDGKALQTSLIAILRAWDSIHACIPIPPPTGFTSKDADASADALRKTSGDISAALVRIQDTLSGNRQDWIAEQVRLYYFTDVPRLMEILNSNVSQEGGISDAADKATAARKDLLTADLSLADARAEVNKYQRQVLVLQEELRQAQAEVKAKGVLFTSTSKLVNRLTDRQAAVQTKANASAGDLNSTDPIKKAAAEKDKSNLDSTTSQLTDAQRSNDSAQKDRDAAQQRLDTAQDAQQGLPAKIDAAKQALEGAQSNVNSLQNAALVAAQDASEALAAARDHTPHLKTTPIGTSTDPAHRVELFGFTDSKSIFIRGSRNDVEAVKGLIAQFDQPSPQARITLWSLQLNSAGDPNNNKATIRFNHALSMVENDLSTTRGLVAASLSLLRETVSKYVNSNDRNGNCASAAFNTPFNEETLRVRRLKCFYEEEVLWRLAGNPAGNESDEKVFARVSRYTIPDPAAVTTLGEALMVLSLARREMREAVFSDFEKNLLSSLEGLALPDPADKSTKNPPDPLRRLKANGRFALMEHFLSFPGGPADVPVAANNQAPGDEVFRLQAEVQTAKENIARHETRLTDLQQTIAKIQATGRIETPGEEMQKLQADIQNTKGDIAKHEAHLADLGRKSMELDARVKKLETLPNPPSGTIPSQLSSRQSELIYALQSSTLSKIQKAIASLAAQLQKVELDAQSADLKLAAAIALPADKRDSGRETSLRFQQQKLKAARMTISSRLAPLLFYCYSKYGLILGNGPKFKEAADNKNSTQRLSGIADATTAPAALQFSESISTLDPLRTANPRVAAADEMLKELMIAVEDDLDRLFIHPMLDRLRDDLTDIKELQVGVLQRTSVLATNRLVASVDPRASAQLSVGSETDILQSLLQLGEVFVAAKTAGPTGALNALNAQKREAPPEVYSLNTGSQFKVTPIFDPSGQALRFQFDYVANTQIQEPNGSTNTQLPRIERHNVNTEVQISNMEMREISRFEANSKIGIPDTFWGGVPIIKDIPFIKDNPKVRAWFPLLGWFVRKKGEAAASQESIIFGQTTIYPTIADIVNLLTSTETSQE